MAAKYAVRWRPPAYRSTIETIIQNKELNANPPRYGNRVKVLQLVAYDDASINAQNPYRPGHPDTERYIEVAEEVVISLDVGAFVGKSVAQSTAIWNAARDEQIARWQANNAGLPYLNAAIGVHLSNFVLLN